MYKDAYAGFILSSAFFVDVVVCLFFVVLFLFVVVLFVCCFSFLFSVIGLFTRLTEL